MGWSHRLTLSASTGWASGVHPVDADGPPRRDTWIHANIKQHISQNTDTIGRER